MTRKKVWPDGWPNFGMVCTVHSDPPYPDVELEARAIVPGKTLHDLTMAYYNAEQAAKESDSFSGDPSKWPTVRGVTAVVDMMFKAIRDGHYEIVSKRSNPLDGADIGD